MKAGVIVSASRVASLVAALVPVAAVAQSFPVKPIRLIVPFPPGGGTDEIAQWVGVLAPAATPRELVLNLHAAIVKALGTAKVAQQFAEVGSERIVSSPEEFAAHIRTEIAKWGKVIKSSNMPLE